MTKVWKRVGCIGAILGIVFLLYLGLTMKRVASELLAQEEFGGAHFVIFQAVDQFAISTGRFPQSIEELASFEFDQNWAHHDWAKNQAYYQDIVEPIFEIELSAESINEFSPHFDTLPPWAAGHCRSSWELILENCTPTDEP